MILTKLVGQCEIYVRRSEPYRQKRREKVVDWQQKNTKPGGLFDMRSIPLLVVMQPYQTRKCRLECETGQHAGIEDARGLGRRFSYELALVLVV